MLRYSTWQLIHAAIVEISAGASALVDHWRNTAAMPKDIRQQAEVAADEGEDPRTWYFGDEHWLELDITVRPTLFISVKNKLQPVFNGRSLVQHLRRLIVESGEATATFNLRPADTAATTAPSAGAPRGRAAAGAEGGAHGGGAHGGARANAQWTATRRVVVRPQ